MKIFGVGDSYMPIRVFARAFNELEAAHQIELLQLDESEKFVPTTESERSLREFTGTPRQLVERMSGVEALVVHGAPVTDEVLDASDALRLVCCARGGPLNVDVLAASARGLPVVTTPGKNAQAVADQTIAFMIMLGRRFPKAQRFVLEGGLLGKSAFEGAEFLGHELGGHVLGLVGYGNVGRRVAFLARAFGMIVLAYDPYLQLNGEEQVEQVEQVGELSELLARADFVSLHARSTRDNDNLFGSDEFGAMKPGSYFVNTARETLVDEQALDAALASGHLAGAALDVVRPWAVSGPHPHLQYENVVVTPHVGGATHETLLRGATMIAEEIRRFTNGEPLVSVINRAARDE